VSVVASAVISAGLELAPWVLRNSGKLASRNARDRSRAGLSRLDCTSRAIDRGLGMGRLKPDGNLTIVASWSGNGSPIPTGTQWRLGEGNLTNMVAQTGRPARLDRPVQGTGQLSVILRDTGIRFAEERADGVAARRLALAAPSRGSPPAAAPDRHPPASSHPHDAKAPHNRRPDARDSPRRSARNRSSCSGVTPRLADHQPPEPQPNL
jgi:hypothetical protein